jgi:hypothetical protein
VASAIGGSGYVHRDPPQVIAGSAVEGLSVEHPVICSTADVPR